MNRHHDKRRFPALLEQLRVSGYSQLAGNASFPSPDMDCLPETARLLIQILGQDAAMRLIEKYGGLSLRVPLGKNSAGKITVRKLTETTGEEAASNLIAMFGGTVLYIPKCVKMKCKERDKALIRDRAMLAALGMTERRIVKTLSQSYGISDRHVWSIFKRPVPLALPEPVSAASCNDWDKNFRHPAFGRENSNPARLK